MIQLLILLGLLYLFKNTFADITDSDVDDYLVMDIIADGEFDGDIE